MHNHDVVDTVAHISGSRTRTHSHTISRVYIEAYHVVRLRLLMYTANLSWGLSQHIEPTTSQPTHAPHRPQCRQHICPANSSGQTKQLGVVGSTMQFILGFGPTQTAKPAITNTGHKAFNKYAQPTVQANSSGHKAFNIRAYRRTWAHHIMYRTSYRYVPPAGPPPPPCWLGRVLQVARL